MAIVLIQSQDYQYGQYLKCLVQQVDAVNELYVLDNLTEGPYAGRELPGLVVVHSENENDCEGVQNIISALPQIPVIVVADNGAPGLKQSDVVCLGKPLDAVDFVQCVHKYCFNAGSKSQNGDQVPIRPYLIGNSPKIQELRRKIARVSKSDFSVLVCGQTGTGKGVVAQAVHNSSGRNGDFLYLNCANVSGSLLESELFGYKRGAFTGAWKDKPGRLQQAGEGSIFLDEISEMSPYMQAKLLHVLQEKEFYPVGGTSRVEIKSRIIAATNADLRKAMHAGTFREDLYYRLAVVRLDLPPLKERREDIPLLTQYFLDQFCIKYDKPNFPRLSDKLWDMFQMYDWPGNVRELESCINGLVALESEEMVREEMYAKLPDRKVESKQQPRGENVSQAASFNPGLDSGHSLKELTDKAACRAEAEIISRVLHYTGGKKKKAASALNVSYKSLLKKIKSYGL